MKRRVLAALAACAVLGGCASIGNKIATMVIKPVDVTELSKASDTEKAAKLNKVFASTVAHDQLTATFGSADATSPMAIMKAAYAKGSPDAAALQKVKKVAILGFTMNVDFMTMTGSSGYSMTHDMTGIQGFVDQMHDGLKASLEAAGFEVVSPSLVAAQESYKALPYPNHDATVHWASAYGLKDIPEEKLYKDVSINVKTAAEEIRGRLAAIEKVARSLGADAAVIASCKVYIQHSGISGKVTVSFGKPGEKQKVAPSVGFNIVSASEPKIIWSAAMGSAAVVPTQARSASGAKLVFNVHEYKLSELGPDMVPLYRSIADLAVFKLRQDKLGSS